MAEYLVGQIIGKKGDTGSGLTILDCFATFDELTSAVTNPSVGDAYGVGSDKQYEIYTYTESNDWVNHGKLAPDIDNQTPHHKDVQGDEIVNLESGENIGLALGKIKNAIRWLISHIGDTIKHVTSEERTTWNGKAPGGHGLGVIADGTRDISFYNFLKNGGGFYQVRTTEDAPDQTSKWFGLLQLSRSVSETTETGVQLAFDDNDVTNPRMWMRTTLSGNSGGWCEMLHTGNIDKHIKIVSGKYRGDGKFGSSNMNSISLDFIPQVMIISRGSGTPYHLTETSIIHFAYDQSTSRYIANTNKVLAGSEFAYSPSLTMYYKDGAIQWYTDSADSKRYKADLQTGYMKMETLTYSGDEADKMKAINQLNWSERVYHYFILGAKE